MSPSKSDLIAKLPTDDEALLDLLRREVDYERKLNRRIWIGFKIEVVLIVLGFLGKLWAIGKSDALQVLSLALWMIGFLIFMSVGAFDLVQRQARKKFRLELLEKLENDKRAIGHLLMFISSGPSEEVTPYAINMLKTLLPSLHMDDANVIQLDQQEALVKLLRHEDKGLVVAVLKALEQIGDERALVPVERLAMQTKYPQVQQAAQECLPYLQTRAQEKERVLTLLRPSDSPTAPETLLRPTSAATDDAQEQLLRPTE